MFVVININLHLFFAFAVGLRTADGLLSLYAVGAMSDVAGAVVVPLLAELGEGQGVRLVKLLIELIDLEARNFFLVVDLDFESMAFVVLLIC